jgi:hypothetical protein
VTSLTSLKVGIPSVCQHILLVRRKALHPVG